MKNLFKYLIGGLVLISSQAMSADKNPLQGSWEWVNIKNSCVETYIFGTGNTAHITSGEEISDAEYHISDKLTEKGFYKVTLKILKDKGGKDCGESLENNTGDVYNKFVMFHPSGNQYVSCDKETIEECVGPLKRIE
ncbi:MAG: hypothetical protein CTY37_00695 [Methylotenera sp.]|nr:MAG: hypothetical protein CTY37_00695 [Methylotenera sp.]